MFFKLDMRDTMKLAPPGSPLASLGESLGIEKMDTNVLDKQDNKPLNFYKENMKELRKIILISLLIMLSVMLVSAMSGIKMLKILLVMV